MTAINGPKRGDTVPDLVVDLVASPTTTDLTQVDTWRIIGRLYGDEDALVVDDVPDVNVDSTDKWKAVATHQWEPAETALAGLMLLELEATWPSGAKQTFPTSGYIQIRIADDLG